MYPITIYPEKDDFSPVTLVGGTLYKYHGIPNARECAGKTSYQNTLQPQTEYIL